MNACKDEKMKHYDKRIEHSGSRRTDHRRYGRYLGTPRLTSTRCQCRIRTRAIATRPIATSELDQIEGMGGYLGRPITKTIDRCPKTTNGTDNTMSIQRANRPILFGRTLWLHQTQIFRPFRCPILAFCGNEKMNAKMQLGQA